MKEIKLIPADIRLISQAIINSREAENSSAEPVLIETVKASDVCIMALLNGEVACIFGFYIQNATLGHIYLWMFITDLAEKNELLFLRKSKEFIESLSQKYSYIYGHLDPRYCDSRRWLEWLGFEFHGPDPNMNNALAFSKGER